MATRLLFVCPNGHVFRSLAKLKPNRRRVCRVCETATPDSRGRSTMAAARRMAALTGVGKSCIQVFSDGQIKIRPKGKATA